MNRLSAVSELQPMLKLSVHISIHTSFSYAAILQCRLKILQHKPCLRLEAMAQEPVLKKQRVTLERVFQVQGVEQHERIIFEKDEADENVVDATVDGEDIITEK